VRTMFLLLRAGKPTEAAEVAARCGAAWRAASLVGGGAGWLPVRAADPNAHANDDGGLSLAAGDAAAADVLAGSGVEAAERYATAPCAARARWRTSCRAVARAAKHAGAGGAGSEGGLLEVEAALYGALAGSVGYVLPVCECWEDELWAHARCLLQVLPEESLARAVQSGDGVLAAGGIRKRPWQGAALLGEAAVPPPRGPAPDQVAADFLVRPYSIGDRQS
jgi:Nuclear pore protein 84 / 107